MVVERWIDVPERDQPTARDVAVARLAARQHGVLCVDELRACGLSLKAISVRVANGRLHPLHRGVFAVGHANPPRDGWMLAAVKACGDGAVLCLWSAAAVQNIITWEDRYPDVVVLGLSAPQHPRVKGHRTSYLPAEHVTTVRGIP